MHELDYTIQKGLLRRGARHASSDVSRAVERANDINIFNFKTLLYRQHPWRTSKSFDAPSHPVTSHSIRFSTNWFPTAITTDTHACDRHLEQRIRQGIIYVTILYTQSMGWQHAHATQFFSLVVGFLKESAQNSVHDLPR